jgi:hypothetical protein
MNMDRASPDLPIDCLEQSTSVTQEGRVDAFVIFDSGHDGDLYELLRVQSDSPGCRFSVIGGSRGSSDTEAGQERVRRQIREADQVIVICGEHSEDSPQIHTELLIARDTQTPYFLLWGRRGVMCTKPNGAERTDGMYSWTGQFLNDQIAFNLRNRSTEMEARGLRRKPRDTAIPTATVTTREESSENTTTEPTST